jgi:histidyl-tRNA synthetase
MFRHERPQKGRTRQFHQIGAEIFGAHGPDVDAELILMGERLWRTLGLGDLRLEINSLGNGDERRAYRAQLVAFLDTIKTQLDAQTWCRVEKNPLRVLDSKDEQVLHLLEKAPVLADFLGEESSAHFGGLCEMLDKLGVEYVINPRLVRGLDYYSHTVFEWISNELGAQATVCAGGRYDSLVELQGGKPWPGIGFAMGQERLVELIRNRGEVSSAAPNVYMVLAGSRAKAEGMELAEKLRDEVDGLTVICNPGDGSFKSQFKRADRSGAELALVIGEDEIENSSATIKPLRDDQAQENVKLTALADWLDAWIKRN